MTATEYLARPYARRLVPDPDGGFVANIQEFPGLIAEGNSADEALNNLESAARAWIEASLEGGREIPDPIDLDGFSGKIALRIPRSLHRRAAEMANMEGSSLNQWITTAVAYYLGERRSATLMVNFSTTHVTQVVIPALNFSPRTSFAATHLPATDMYVQDLTPAIPLYPPLRIT